jgi:N-acetylglucosamine kinase-like BadF-type ATPase
MKFLLIDFGASRVKTIVYNKTTNVFTNSNNFPSPFIQNSTISIDELTSLLQNIVSPYKDIDGIVICTILGGVWIDNIYHSWKSPLNKSKGSHCLISKIFNSNVHEDHKSFTDCEKYLSKLTQIGKICDISIYSSLGDTNCALRSINIPENGVVINIGTGSQVISKHNIERYFPAGRSFLVFQQLFNSIGLDFFTLLSKITYEDVITSTLQINLANFTQSRGFTDGGSISQILEETFTINNLLGSLLKTFVTQYKSAIGEANTIILLGGMADKIKILPQLFKHYYPHIDVISQYNEIEATHLGMAQYIIQNT